MHQTTRFTQFAIATFSLVALAACGGDSPTTPTAELPDLSGTWRFTWTLHERVVLSGQTTVDCPVEVQFALGASGSLLEGVQEGSSRLECNDDEPLDLEGGTLSIVALTPFFVTFQTRWTYDYPAATANALIAAYSDGWMAGTGTWSYLDEWIGYRIDLDGIFTAERLP